MNDDLDLGVALRFLKQLAKNNNKPWFDAHKADYQAAAAQFELLVGNLIAGMGKVQDLGGVTPKDCMMRIYRDVRFSRDKSPYKTGFGATIAPGGRKSGRLGYHLHLAPNGTTMAAGGMWEPEPQQLSRFRDAIVKDAGPFHKITGAADFKRHFTEVTGEALKTAPKGYPADHPEMGLLRQKQVCVFEKFSDDEVAGPGFSELVLKSFRAMKPFIDYLDKAAMGA